MTSYFKLKLAVHLNVETPRSISVASVSNKHSKRGNRKKYCTYHIIIIYLRLHICLLEYICDVGNFNISYKCRI